MPDNSTGIVTVKVNGSVYKTKKTEMTDDTPTEYVGCKYYFSSFDDLKRDETYEIEVIYDADYGSYYKKEIINLTSSMVLYRNYYTCDDDFYLGTGDNLTKDLIIEIDGDKFDYNKVITYYEFYDYFINISNLKFGNHTVKAYYPGDDIYPAKTFTFDFVYYVKPKLSGYSGYHEYGDNLNYTLKFPSDATGNVTVEILDWNDDIYSFSETLSLKKGEVTFNRLYWNILF